MTKLYKHTSAFILRRLAYLATFEGRYLYQENADDYIPIPLYSLSQSQVIKLSPQYVKTSHLHVNTTTSYSSVATRKLYYSAVIAPILRA